MTVATPSTNPAPPPLRQLPRRPPAAPSQGTRRIPPETLALWLWTAALAAALWLLHVGLATRISDPPAAPGAWGAWIDTVGGAAALVSVLRVVTLAVVWYLTVVTVAGLLLRWRQSPHVLALDRVTPSRLLPLLDHRHGVIAAVVLTATVAPLAVPRSPTGAVPAPVESVTPAMATPAAVPAAGEPTAMRIQATPSGPFLPDIAIPTPLALPTPVTEQAPATAPLAPQPERWLVEPGDHLWSIATAVVGDLTGHVNPSDAEVGRYWSALVAANRDRLVDPANADLIYPGQEFVLPALDPT